MEQQCLASLTNKNDWQTVMLTCGEPFGVHLTFKKQDRKDEEK
jgi:hypothetical protein